MSRMFGYRVIGLGSGGDGGANRSTRVTINLDIESTTQNYNIYSNRGGTYVAGKSDVTLTVDAIVGSAGTGQYAIDTGNQWTSGDTLKIINNSQKGAMIFISPELKAINTLKRLKILKKKQVENKIIKAPIFNMDDRDFGIGAQILHDMDITNLKLITNTKSTRRVGMIGYGLKISEYINF